MIVLFYGFVSFTAIFALADRVTKKLLASSYLPLLSTIIYAPAFMLILRTPFLSSETPDY